MERSITSESVKTANRMLDAERALLVAKRLRDANQMRADSSTFSALNIEYKRQTSSGSKFSRQMSEIGPQPFSRQSSFGRQLSAPMTKAKMSNDVNELKSQLINSLNSLPLSRQVSKVAEPQAPETRSYTEVRDEFMRFRNVEEEEKPSEISNFVASVVKSPRQNMVVASPVAAAPMLEASRLLTTSAMSPMAMSITPKDKPAGPPGNFTAPPGVFTSPTAGGPFNPYSHSANVCDMMFVPPMVPDMSPASRPRRASLNENDEIKRSVQSLLNKVCPENVQTIVERIASIKVSTAEQLEIIIEAIFRKALLEPHYCETYADLVFSLKSVFPQFPSPDGGKPMTFKSSVLNVCQNEFEELVTSGEPQQEDKEMDPEEMEFQRRKRKDRMRANMKFIGHLFLRQLLSAKVIGSVICELVLCVENTDYVPEEHAIECACELLMCIGHTLEQLPTGFQALQLVTGRLYELKSRKTTEGKGVYSKRIGFMIQDLLDTRAAGWSVKTFKTTAKTKEEIRLEQQRDLDMKARGIESPMAEHVVAGQRPTYLAPTTPTADASA